MSRVIERKKQTIRHVRTPEGAERYGQPIGSIIVLDEYGNVVETTGPAAVRPGEDGPVQPDLGRLEAPPEAIDGHLRGGLPTGWEFGQEHSVDRDLTHEQRQAAHDAAVVAKREVVADLTRRLAHVPDEELLDQATRTTHERLSRGDSVMLRKPQTWSNGEVRPGLYDYREVSAERFDDAGGDDLLDEHGLERVSAGQYRDDARAEQVSQMVALWAATSNGTNPRALTMQAIAEETFGLSNVMPWDARLSKDDEQAMIDVRRDLGGRYREFLLAQYAATQERFREQGITDVRLFRGVRAYGDDKPAWAVPGFDRQGVSLRPLSSFTSDRRVAAKFAEQGADYGTSEGYLLESIVPVERIIATPRTGVGCLTEAEFVVLAGDGAWDVHRTSKADTLPPPEEHEPSDLLDLDPPEPEPADLPGPPRGAARMVDADGREVFIDLDSSVPVGEPTQATAYAADGAVLGRLEATTADPSVNSFRAVDPDGQPVGEEGEVADVLAAMRAPGAAPVIDLDLDAAEAPEAPAATAAPDIDLRTGATYMNPDADKFYEVVDGSDPTAVVLFDSINGGTLTRPASDLVGDGWDYYAPAAPFGGTPIPDGAWFQHAEFGRMLHVVDGSDPKAVEVRDIDAGLDLTMTADEVRTHHLIGSEDDDLSMEDAYRVMVDMDRARLRADITVDDVDVSEHPFRQGPPDANDDSEASYAFMHGDLSGDIDARAKDAKRGVATALAERMTDVPDDALLRTGNVGWYDLVAALKPGSPVVRSGGDGTQGVTYTPWREDWHGDRFPTVPSDDPQLIRDARASAVSQLISRWAATSNDSDAEALAIQQIAADLFGLDDVHTWDVPPGTQSLIDQRIAEHEPVYRAFLKAQYEETQERLAAAGLDEVTLYRGVALDDRPGWALSLPGGDDEEDEYDDFGEGGGPLGIADGIALRPLSSFTTAPPIAVRFAKGTNTNQGGSYSYVLHATVPRQRILSTPRSGFGCLSEAEYVVLGGTFDAQVWNPTDLELDRDTDMDDDGFSGYDDDDMGD